MGGRIQIRQGSGPAIFFGTLFTSIVVGVALEPGDLPPVTVALMFVPGIVLLLGRRGVTLHPSRNRARTWWGIWIPPFFYLPAYWRTRDLDEFQRVEFDDEIRTSRNSRTNRVRSWTVYAVHLKGPGGASLPLGHRLSYQRARRLAEWVAKFLGWPLGDTVYGHASKRESGELDRPLRDRVARPDAVEQPGKVTVQERHEGGARVFEIPPTGESPLTNSAPVLLALGGATVGIEWLLDSSPATGMLTGILILVGLMGVGAVALIFPALKRGSSWVRLVVSKASIRVVRGWLLWRSSYVIPIDELEELEVCSPKMPKRLKGRPPGSVISARSDREVVEFGRGLPDRELKWLQAEILREIIPGSGE